MKTRRILCIFIVSVVVVAGSCNSSIAATYVSNEAVLESSFLPSEALLPVTADHQSEPVAILFLIDKSGSIIGMADSSDECDANIPEGLRPHAGARYIADVLSHLPEDYSQNIHVGFSRFGDGNSQIFKKGYSPIVKLAPANTLKDTNYTDELENSYQDSDTDYASALSMGYDDLRKYSDSKKIMKQMIVVLTDGFGADDETEKVLANIPLDVQIYVNLVCPDKGDVSFWARHRIPTSKFPDEWLSNFWHIPDVQQALPPKSGWVYGKNEWEIRTDSDVNQVDFKYFSWQDPGHHNFTVNGNDDFSINTIPEPDCSEHKFPLKTRSTDRGFWWVETKTPSIAEITVSPHPLTNELPTEIEVHLSGGDFDSGEMAKWKDCYKDFTFEFTTSNGQHLINSSLEPLPCPDGGSGLCPEKGGDGLYGRWRWHPSEFQNPVDINIKVKLTITNFSGNSTEIESKPYKIPIVFQPKFVSMVISKMPDNEWYFWDLTFNFDINEPTIYLLQTRPFVNEGCPLIVAIPGTSLHGYFVSQNTQRNNLNAKANSSHAKGVGGYQLSIKRAVVDKCGFDQVFFVWKADPNSGVDASTWMGNLEKLPHEEDD